MKMGVVNRAGNDADAGHNRVDRHSQTLQLPRNRMYGRKMSVVHADDDLFAVTIRRLLFVRGQCTSRRLDESRAQFGRGRRCGEATSRLYEPGPERRSAQPSGPGTCTVARPARGAATLVPESFLYVPILTGKLDQNDPGGGNGNLPAVGINSAQEKSATLS